MRNQADDNSYTLLSKVGLLRPDSRALQSSHTGSPESRSSIRQWCSRLFYETWLLEICILALSLGCIAGVIIVLRVFDGNPQPQFPSGITLNAIVSTLGTASKAALIFVVAASLSQLKWGWYQDRQRLNDIQCFDDASRGPLGSLLLLTQRPARSLASFGALITVIALAFDPFLQQVLTFYPQMVYSQAGSYETKATSGFTQQGTEFLVGALDMGFVESLNRGVWSDPSQFERNPVCATGNCTWPVFESVGWCHKCENATSRAILKDCDLTATAEDFTNANTTVITRWCNVSFTGSDGITGHIPLNISESGSVDTYWEYVWPAINDVPWVLDNLTILGLENPVAAMSYVRFPGFSSMSNISTMRSMLLQDARECVLDFCVRTYNVSVSSGEPSVTTLNATFGDKFAWAPPAEKAVYWDDYYCWKGRDTPVAALQLEAVNLSSPYDMVSSQREGYVDRKNLAFCVLNGKYMSGQNMQHEYWYWGGRIAGKLTGSTQSMYTCQNGTCGLAATEYNEWGGGGVADSARWIHTVGLEQVMENLAASLTNMTVATGDGPQIAGRTGHSIIYVRVRWGWLALPAGLSLSAAVLLLMTMVTTWRKGSPMWKASLFPLLFHGLDDEGRSQTAKWAAEDETASHSTKVSEMMGAASQTRVRLKAAEGDTDSGKLLLST